MRWRDASDLLHASSSSGSALTQFEVFFSDGAGSASHMVMKMDAAHAKDIARTQQPTGKLSAVPAKQLDGHATSC